MKNEPLSFINTPSQEMVGGRGIPVVSAIRRMRENLPDERYVPFIRRHPWVLDVVELVLLLAIIFMMTQSLRTDAQDNTRMPGAEMNYLVNSGAVAADVFQRYHTIPLWNPLIGNGEPLFESLFSYVLNPFMSVPLLALGTNAGINLALVLHYFLIGMGGWVLGRSLKLHAGALLLGIMMAASGSMTAPLSHGFFQIGLSLAYAPWVYAGLIGLLYREHYRRWLGVFVVALTMMTFAGTFWFVVPAGFGCAAIALISLIKPKQPGLFRQRVHHLLVAGGFFLGFAALSFLPRLNSYLVYHPAQGLGTETYDIGQIFNSFFVADRLVPDEWYFVYQYMIPGTFVLVVLIGRLALGWLKSPFARWRILLPSALMILFFCYWAQDNTPLFHLIYDHTPLIQWRWPVRVAAAAAPFIGLMIAMWFDEIVVLLMRLRLEFWLVALAVVGFGVYTATKSSQEWNNALHLEPYGETTAPYQAMVRLRQDHPGEQLSMLTEGMMLHTVLYKEGIRTPYGNPDIFTNGPPPDFPYVMNWWPTYAFADNDGYRGFLQAWGYVPYSNSPVDQFGGITLWFNAHALPYAFVVPPGTLEKLTAAGLTADLVEPVTSMYDHYNSVQLTVNPSKDDSILVLHQTDYPGWEITVDGQPGRIKSFNGLTSVVLSAGMHTVVFTYHSPLLVLGFIIYLITLVLFVIYLFHIDQRIKGTRFDPTPRVKVFVATHLVPRIARGTGDGFASEA